MNSVILTKHVREEVRRHQRRACGGDVHRQEPELRHDLDVVDHSPGDACASEVDDEADGEELERNQRIG